MRGLSEENMRWKHVKKCLKEQVGLEGTDEGGSKLQPEAN